jgi:hypothetical protein
MYALARLRGVPIDRQASRAQIEKALRICEPMWDLLRRKRRRSSAH